MYAAAKAKPQSIEAEQLGPAPIPRPHLVATYKPGRVIYAQGDLNDKCYQVSTGAVRIYRLLSDGRRQVVSFQLPGEMFGFEAGSNHAFFAEAITETTLAIFGRRNMQERSRELLALALTGMARAQQHLLVIGRQCAVERIAAFLVDLCERQGGGRQLRLPMSRQDIA
ncbi:cyclic nucleotide-binding domain-containing protein, partial [Sinorhizobium meliloti]